jgi:hypothetical protein
MASMARQKARDPFPFGFPGLPRALARLRAEQTSGWAILAGDDLTSRAIAAAGLASLAALPVLLLSSVLFDAPLAVPAAIGVCYLAVSRALSGQRLWHANFTSAGILFALLAWPVSLLTGNGWVSLEGAMVALIAPVFAAAPAIARFVIAQRARSKSAVEADLRQAALMRVADREKLAPTEQLLVLDRNATVLGASASARSALGLLPDAFEHALHGMLTAEGLRRVFCSIGGRGTDPIRLDLTFETIDADKHFTATLSSCGDGCVAMRLQEREGAHSCAVATDEVRASEIASNEEVQGPIADIGEASGFALKHASHKSKTKELRVTSDLNRADALGCDRQVARRIASLVIGAAFDTCEIGATIHIETRALRGVVLLRTTTSPRKPVMETASKADNRFDMTALQTLIDSIGGTLVLEQRHDESVASVRLPLAPAPTILRNAAA